MEQLSKKRHSSTPGATCTRLIPTGCGTSATSRATLYTLGNGIRSSYTMQAAVGLDQQLGRAATMSVNYLSARGVHEYMTRNFYDQTIPGTTAPTTPYSYQYQSAGVYRQNQDNVQWQCASPSHESVRLLRDQLRECEHLWSWLLPDKQYRYKGGLRSRNVRLPPVWSLRREPKLSSRCHRESVHDCAGGHTVQHHDELDPFGSSIYNTRPYFRNGSSGNCFNGSTSAPPELVA